MYKILTNKGMQLLVHICKDIETNARQQLDTSCQDRQYGNLFSVPQYEFQAMDNAIGVNSPVSWLFSKEQVSSRCTTSLRNYPLWYRVHFHPVLVTHLLVFFFVFLEGSEALIIMCHWLSHVLNFSPRSGIEPRPFTWQAEILTTRLTRILWHKLAWEIPDFWDSSQFTPPCSG
jgi:hypothetical protein